MKILNRYSYKVIIFPTVIIALISWVSYWSSYHFDFKNLCLTINFSVNNISVFWTTFTSLTTTIGILAALFKEQIQNLMFIPYLKLKTFKKQGVINFENNHITIFYLLQVENQSNIKVKDVDFFYESICENDNEDTLLIRRPMAWSRYEEKRHDIEIIDRDNLDFIRAFINIRTNELYYEFRSRGPLFNVNQKITKKTEVIITSNYYNQKKFDKYKYIISINTENWGKVFEFIKNITEKLTEELHEVQNDKNNEKPLDRHNYNYLKIVYDENDFISSCVEPQKIYKDNYTTFEAYVKNILTSQFLQKIKESNFLMDDAADIFLKISEIINIEND